MHKQKAPIYKLSCSKAPKHSKIKLTDIRENPVAVLAKGRRVAHTPFRINKKKLILFRLFIFFPYSRKYFSFYVAKCQNVVCVRLLSNAIAS